MLGESGGEGGGERGGEAEGQWAAAFVQGTAALQGAVGRARARGERCRTTFWRACPPRPPALLRLVELSATGVPHCLCIRMAGHVGWGLGVEWRLLHVGWGLAGGWLGVAVGWLGVGWRFAGG